MDYKNVNKKTKTRLIIDKLEAARLAGIDRTFPSMRTNTKSGSSAQYKRTVDKAELLNTANNILTNNNAVDLGIYNDILPNKNFVNVQEFYTNMINFKDILGKQQGFTAISFDTEWVFGGEAGAESLMQLGYNTVKMDKYGQISHNRGHGNMYFKLTPEAKNKYDALIKKLEDAKKYNTSPKINADERRSLIDIVKIANTIENGSSGITAKESFQKLNLHTQILPIESLIDNIDTIKYAVAIMNGDHQDVAKVLDIKDFSQYISYIYQQNTGSLPNQESISIWHNGYNADFGVISRATGSNPFENMINIDTFAMLNMGTDDIMYDLYKGKKVKNPGSLETLQNLFLTKADLKNIVNHRADDDAFVGGKLFEFLYNKKSIEKNKFFQTKHISQALDTFEVGDKVRSISGLQIDNDMEMVFEYGKNGGISDAVDYSNISVYKNGLYTIEKEFTEVKDGQTYYGVVLKNEFGNSGHIIADTDINKLRQKIQNTFRTANNLTTQEIQDINTNYINERSQRHLRSMHNGDSSFFNFNKSVEGLRALNQNLGPDLDITNPQVRIDMEECLINKAGMTATRAKAFINMYPRLNSEAKDLFQFSDLLTQNNVTDYAQRNAAIQLFSYRMDEKYGKHLSNIVLPNVNNQPINRQVMLPNLAGELEIKTAKDKDALSNSIRNLISRDLKVDNKYAYQDFMQNTYEFISLLTMDNGNGVVLSKKQARKLAKDVGKVLPNENNTLRGSKIVSDIISNVIYDKLNPVTVIKDQFNLGARTLPNQVSFEVAEMESIIAIAQQKFGKNGELISFDNKVTDALDVATKQSIARIQDITSGTAVKEIMPNTLYESLEMMAQEYSKKDIGIDIDLISNSKKHGINLKFYNKNARKGVGPFEGKAANVFIPLADQSGLVRGNMPYVNRVFVQGANNSDGIKITTLQNKLFDELLEERNIYSISKKIIEEDNVDTASFILRKRIEEVISGNVSGTKTNTNDVIKTYGTSPLANQRIADEVNISELIQKVTGVKSLEKMTEYNYLVPKKHFLSMLNIDSAAELEKIFKISKMSDKQADKYTKAYRQAVEVKNALEKFNIDLSFEDVKGETAQKGIISLKKRGAKRFFVGNIYTDPGRENMRQALNFRTLGLSDVVDVTPNTEGKNRPTRRYDKLLNTFGKEKTDRLLRTGVTTSARDAVMGDHQAGLNLRVAFATDDDIEAAMINNGVNPDNLLFTQVLTTEENMLAMDTKIGEQFTYVNQRTYNLEAGERINPTLLKSLEEEGNSKFISKNTKIKLAEGKKREILSEKYDTVIKGWGYDAEKGNFYLNVDEIIKGKEGTKVQELGGATKGTISMATGVNGETLGAIKSLTGLDVDAIMKPEIKKSPSTIITSQLDLMVEQIEEAKYNQNVGDAKVKEMQDAVDDIVNRIFGITNTKWSEYEAGGRTHLRYNVDDIDKDFFRLTDVVDYTDKWLNKYGQTVTSNRYTLADGTKILIGNLQLATMDVNDYTDITDKGGSAMRMESRGLSLFFNGANYENGYIKATLQQMMKDQNGRYYDEVMSIEKTLSEMALPQEDKKKYGIVALKNADELEKTYGQVMSFSDVQRVAGAEDGGVFDIAQMSNTLMGMPDFDKKYRKSNGFYLQLPETVKVDGYEVNEIFFRPTNYTAVTNGGKAAYLETHQNSRRYLINSLQDYADAMASGNLDDLNRARENIKNNTISLIEQYGKDITSSKGFMGKNFLSLNFEASGHYKLRGISSKYLSKDAMKYMQGFKEGQVVTSRNTLKQLAEKLDFDEASVKALLEQAEKEGVAGLAIRDPNMAKESTHNVLLRILPENIEEQFSSSFNDSVAYITSGMAQAIRGDFDGDVGALALFKEKAVKTWQDLVHSKTYEQQVMAARKTSQRDLMIFDANDTDAFAKAKKVSGMLFGDPDDSIIRKRSEFSRKTISTFAGVGKEVGRISNLAVHYRLLNQGGNKDTRPIGAKALDAFMNATEQVPISSKRLTDALDAVDAGSGSDDAISNVVLGQDVFTEGMEKGDVDKIIQGAKEAGILQQEILDSGEKGEWYLAGLKNEGTEASIDIFGDASQKVYESDIREGFELLVDRYNASNLRQVIGDYKVGLSGVRTAGQSLDYVKDLVTGNTKKLNFATENVKAFTGPFVDSDLIDDAEREMAAKMYQQSRIKHHGWTATAEDMAQKAVQTAGQAASSGVSASTLTNAAQKVANGSAPSTAFGIGAALLGLGVMGSIIGSVTPEKDKEIQNYDDYTYNAGYNNYVDPAIYAGAPAGAAPPTARVMPKYNSPVNVKINGSAGDLTPQQISEIISREVSSQTGLNLNVNVTSSDQRASIDDVWLEDKLANLFQLGYNVK